MSKRTALERARLYLRKMDPAVSKQNGHDVAFRAACAMVRKFNLDEESNFALLWDEYNPRCVPPWSERELRHKVSEAEKEVTERGTLLEPEELPPRYTRQTFKESPAIRPPGGEVLELWENCLPASDDSEVRAWLESRRLDPRKVTERDLCRVLPRKKLPSWAALGKWPWGVAGYRAIFPMYGKSGVIESLHARATSSEALQAVQDGKRPKATPPTGYQVRGLVFANQRALFDCLYTNNQAPVVNQGAVVLITEGETDFLTWATQYEENDTNTPIVFGVVQGSWTQELASRVPSGCRVSIDTDKDKKGQEYEEAIYRSLASRCRVFTQKR